MPYRGDGSPLGQIAGALYRRTLKDLVQAGALVVAVVDKPWVHELSNFGDPPVDTEQFAVLEVAAVVNVEDPRELDER